MPLLTTSDVDWLSGNYPALSPDESCTQVRGELSFTAAYDATSGLFSIARPNVEAPPGMILSGQYNILIKDVVEPKGDRMLLPRLFVDDVSIPFGPERHFNGDKSACLYGPSEEVVLLKEGYLFQKFLEQFCIPFLYAQVYYDRHTHWPWPSYDHGTVGVLQSYSASGGPQSLTFTLWMYLKHRPTWPKVRAVLASKKWPKGHMPCLCESGMPIRHCHPSAWEGLKNLYADVHASGVALPPLEQGADA